MNVDLKNNLELYLPSLFKLIEGDLTKKRWKRLSEIFERKFNELNEKYENGEKPLVRASLYSIINGALNGERQYFQFRDYIDNVFIDLNRLLNDDEKCLIKENISNLLEFEKGFLDYLGELSVLNNLICTGVYKLDETEYRLTKNGKGIDFRLFDKQKSEYVLVEVVNIELKDNKVLNHELIHSFLSEKLNNKLEDTDKSGIHNYTLIPVLWGSITGSLDNILKVKEFYESTNFKIERVASPRVYVPFDFKGEPLKFVNKFGSIHTII